MTSATENPDSAGAAPAPAADGDGAGSATRASEVLDSLAGRPLAEHPDAYEQVHRDLSEALASIDDV
jgi:hypothetical protein